MSAVVQHDSGPASPLRELAGEFCRRTEIAPKTRSAYRDSLARFLAWAEERGCDEPETLTPAVVDAYGRHLEGVVSARGGPLSVASRRTYMKGVQQLLAWLQRRHAVDGIDSKAVQLPRQRKRPRDVLSRREAQQLEDGAPTERNKLIIRLMADTGAREGGVAGVRLADLVERDGCTFVRFRDKTGERLAPVARPLFRRLKAHAAGRTGRPPTSDQHLFMASRRRPHGDYEALTEDGIYGVVKDAAERAGMERRVYPHLLRHSAITWMVAKQMHPALISDVTGVSVAVIAAHYTHASDQQRYQALMTVLRELDE